MSLVAWFVCIILYDNVNPMLLVNGFQRWWEVAMRIWLLHLKHLIMNMEVLSFQKKGRVRDCGKNWNINLLNTTHCLGIWETTSSFWVTIGQNGHWSRFSSAFSQFTMRLLISGRKYYYFIIDKLWPFNCPMLIW